MKIIITLMLYLAFVNFSYAQDFTSNGARAQSLSNSTGASINFWSLINNPSATAFINETSVGIDVKNNFMLKELSSVTLALLLPVNKSGNFAFYLQRFGYSTFNQNKIAISYSKKISKYSSASIKLIDNINNIRSEEINTTEHIIGFNIGMFSKLNQTIHIASFYNYQKNISNLDNYNTQELTLSLSWFPISELNVLMEISKQSRSSIELRGGVEYKIAKRVEARIGVSSEPINVSMGIGILFKNINIDISATHHQYLGSSSNLSGNYIFTKE